MATVANVEWRVGETWRILATMHDSCGAILSIATPAQVKWRLALDGLVLTELEIGDGITLVGDGTAGQCTITLTPADQDTLGVVPTFYTHECQVILPDGTVTDQFAGNVRALPSLYE